MSGPGGFLQMWVGDTAHHVKAIDQVGQTLATGWEEAKSAIDGATGGIGGDPMGQAFAAGFLAASEAVRAACDQVPPRFGALADGGNQSVALYVASQDPAPFQRLMQI